MNLKSILLIFLCTINAQTFAAAESWLQAKPSQNATALINRLAIYQMKHSPYADVTDDVRRPSAEHFFNLSAQEIVCYLRLRPNHSDRYLLAHAEAQRLIRSTGSPANMIAEVLRKHPTAFEQKFDIE